jgi:hypothetical protein
MIKSLLIFGSVVAATSSIAFAQKPPTTPPVPATTATAQPEGEGAVKTARVLFTQPRDGATVKGPDVKVQFAVDGMKVAKAGDMSPLTGHHHVIVDGKALETGAIIPSDKTHLHFGAGQTEATIQLPPGKHTLTLQFADGKHASYGPMLSHTISITVK